MSKVLKIVGMALGAVLIILGIFGYADELFERPYEFGEYLSSVDFNSNYDTGYAEFGADYYTYSNNNAAETSISAKNIAKNAYDSVQNTYMLGREISEIASIAIIIFGAIVLLCFGIKFFDQLAEEKKIKNKAVAAPIQPVNYAPNVQYSPYSVPATPPVDNYQQANL